MFKKRAIGFLREINVSVYPAQVCNDFPVNLQWLSCYLLPVCPQLSKEDCHDALEMICNLESDGDEKAAFSLCSAFLTRQLLQGDSYCAW